jgi:transcriptional regulator with XRE-family HTH domain
MSSILNIIGSNVRHYRTVLGLSQEKLAELARLHRTYVGAVERGERNISAKNIAKIAEVLGIEPYRLMQKKSRKFIRSV